MSSGNIEFRHEVEGTATDCVGTTELSFSDTTDIQVNRLVPSGREMTLTGTVSAKKVIRRVGILATPF